MMQEEVSAIRAYMGTDGMLIALAGAGAELGKACADIWQLNAGLTDAGIAESWERLAKCMGKAAMLIDLMTDSHLTPTQMRAHWEVYSKCYDALRDAAREGEDHDADEQ